MCISSKTKDPKPIRASENVREHSKVVNKQQKQQERERSAVGDGEEECMDICGHGARYRSESSSNSKPSASRSSGGMSPRWRSCSGRRFRLPGELVMIEKLAVVGEIFPADDETDLFAMWL